jgi:hypothetical protein
MPRIKTWLIRSCIATAAAAVGAIGIVSPASAQTNIKICSSSASYGQIEAFKTDLSWSQKLEPGQCTGWINNTGTNPVHVDVNSSIYDDVNSYELGKIGYGYGPCHTYSNNHDSDPPDDAPDGVRYRNFHGGTCN